MEFLEKWPETEMGYWEAIYGLGRYVWSTNHAIRHGHINDFNGENARTLEKVNREIGQLVKEVSEKFGIILPQDYLKVGFGETKPAAPEGKQYYCDWYDKMKVEYYNREYEKIICSACPFSKGVEYMIRLGGEIPCGAVHGLIYRLVYPFMCGMIGLDDSWTEDQLKKEIFNKGGEKAYEVFLAKQIKLEHEYDCHFSEET